MFQNRIPPISAIPPTFINLEFFSKSGQNTRQGYKRRALLYEFNDTNIVYLEKRKAKRLKKA